MTNVSSSYGLEKRPKLRFPGFDGKWEKKALGEITEIKKGEQLPSSDVRPNGQYYHLNGGINPSSRTDRCNVNSNTVSISEGGNSCGYVNWNSEPFFSGGHNYTLQKITESTIPYFLYEALKNKQSEIMALRVGSGLPNIQKKDIERFSLYIPSIEEQKHISDFFYYIDSKIQMQELFVETLKKYKRGLNHRLLFNIDEQYNRELGTVCSIVGGGTPDTIRPEYWEGSIEWFTPSEIGKSKYVLSSNRKISQTGLSNSSAKLLPAGTVLLTTRATLGEMSIARSKCSTNQGFQSLVADSKRVLPEYLYYLQILIKPWCEKYASGNTFREISKSALSKCIVPIPDMDTQSKIVRILSCIDDLIEAEEKTEHSLTLIKKSMLQQLFI